MSVYRHHGGATIFLSFLAALALHMVALPEWAEALRPDWLALVLIYWCIALPDRIGVGYGWLAGLVQDVASGAVLGQHALTLAIVAYLALRLHQRLRLFPLWQQSLSVLILILLHLMLALWIRGSIGHSTGTWIYWLPAVTSMMFWPAVFLTLRRLRRSYRVR